MKRRLSVLNYLFLLRRYVKGVTFLDGRYAKVVVFLSKMVYEIDKGLEGVRGASPCRFLFSSPLPPPGCEHYMTSFKTLTKYLNNDNNTK